MLHWLFGRTIHNSLLWREARNKLLAIGLHRGEPKFRDGYTQNRIMGECLLELQDHGLCDCKSKNPYDVPRLCWFTDDNWRAFAVLATCSKCGATIRLLDCNQQPARAESDQT